MTRYCKICGSELEDDEPDICRNCQSNILINKDIPP